VRSFLICYILLTDGGMDGTCSMCVRNVYSVLVRKPEWKRDLENLALHITWDGNIKTNLKTIQWTSLVFLRV
jgi:hypothetical protein